MDKAQIETLAATVRELDARGSTDDEVAQWLKQHTADFGESGTVLAFARGISKTDAYGALKATATWQRTTTRHRLRLVDGTPFGELHSPNGRTYTVGDHINLPNSPEPPYASKPGRGTVWRVVAVDSVGDPGFLATLTVEAVRRLEG